MYEKYCFETLKQVHLWSSVLIHALNSDFLDFFKDFIIFRQNLWTVWWPRCIGLQPHQQVLPSPLQSKTSPQSFFITHYILWSSCHLCMILSFSLFLGFMLPLGTPIVLSFASPLHAKILPLDSKLFSVLLCYVHDFW